MKVGVLLAALVVPLAAHPFLGKRQVSEQPSPQPTPTRTLSPPRPSPTPTSPVSPEFQPFGRGSGTQTAWRALVNNPSFLNFTALATRFNPELVALLNDTDTNPKSESQTVQQQQLVPGVVRPRTQQQWTVFAPTNAAFQPLLSNAIVALLLQANADVALKPVFARVLNYHVLNSTVRSTDFPPLGQNVTLPTLAGVNVTAQRARDRPQVPLIVPDININGTATSTVDPKDMLDTVPVTTDGATSSAASTGTVTALQETGTRVTFTATSTPAANGGTETPTAAAPTPSPTTGDAAGTTTGDTGAALPTPAPPTTTPGSGDSNTPPNRVRFWVNDAEVIGADNQVRNGVIHVVDALLNPAFVGDAAADSVVLPGSVVVPTDVPSNVELPVPTDVEVTDPAGSLISILPTQTAIGEPVAPE